MPPSVLSPVPFATHPGSLLRIGNGHVGNGALVGHPVHGSLELLLRHLIWHAQRGQSDSRMDAYSSQHTCIRWARF